ncbi:hypothetical protein [Sorangium sp. So ce1182]|uniref:hypothetical protein n=1 Tax=Sorangium sp. So ce1182 TaxID=3133334 RepID=UPI003F63A5FA
MKRRFNTAGPCRPDLHYMVSAESRIPEAPHAPPSEPVTEAPVDLAKERLIFARATHLDSLAERGGCDSQTRVHVSA